MPIPIALLDANVLYPAALRDVLVTLGAFNIYAPRWTNEIHDEWIRNIVLNRPDASRARLEDTRRLMDSHIPGALVEGFEARIETLQLPDANDRHVLAAAIRAQAPFIVTLNLKDFPVAALSPHGIIALSPNEFLLRVLEDRPQQSLEALVKQRSRFSKPALSVEQFLDELRRQDLHQFAEALEPSKNQL